MTANIFNAISDSDFRIKAFSDYCNDTQKAYQKIVQAESLALDVIPDDPDDDTEIDYEAKAIAIMSELDINENNMLLFNYGYISAKEYLIALMKGFENTMVHNTGSLDDLNIILHNAAGQVSGAASVDQLTLEIKENLYSITALCAANASATLDNVADRVSVFNDKLTTVFSNAYSTVSSTATYLRSVISESSFSTASYLATIDALTGVSKLAEDNSIDVPADMDITKYTGANPACALNFNGVFSAVGTVVNVGLKVVGGILSAGAKLIGGIFSTIGNFFHKTIVDPFDIEEIDSKAKSYTVDGWRYNVVPRSVDSGVGVEFYYNNAAFNQYLTNLSDGEIDNYKGQWIKYETIFGELMFKLDSWQSSTNPDSPFYDFMPYVQFKPKAVNPDAVYLSAKTIWGETNYGVSRRAIYTGDGSPTTDQLLAFIDNLRNQPDLYLTTDANEKKLCLAFGCAACLNEYFAQCAFTEMINSLPDNSALVSYPLFDMKNVDDWIAIDLTRAVTNLDFVSAVSGWDEDKYISLPIIPRNDEGISWASHPFPTASQGEMGRYFFLAWILNRADRALRPLDYTFVPYRNNVDSWNASRFRIKTDSENQQAFNTLLTVAIVTVVTAVLAVTATIALKKLVRNIYMKRTAEIGVMDNLMWQGETLTEKQKKRYIRLQRKLNGSAALSSGLQDSTTLFSSVSNSISTVSEDISGVSQITALIKS